MAEGSLDWLMEGLIQFMSSPLWKCNIDQFIDENCLIFDTADENKFTYTDVHNEYKTTVEKLLQRFFLQELNMTLAQLLSACSEGMATNEQYKELFQPLLAVDDFLLFKSIMVSNNLRLNREAEEKLRVLNRIEQYTTSSMDYYNNGKTTLPPNKECLPTKDDSGEQYSSPEPDEEKVLAQVLLQSKLEYDRGVEEEEREFQKLIRAATEESLKCYEMEFKNSKLIEEQLATLTLSDSDEKEEREEEKEQRDIVATSSDPPNYDDLLVQQPITTSNKDDDMLLHDSPQSPGTNSTTTEESIGGTVDASLVVSPSTCSDTTATATVTSVTTVIDESSLVSTATAFSSDEIIPEIPAISNTPVFPNTTVVPIVSNEMPAIPKKRLSADESATNWLETARAEAIDHSSTPQVNDQVDSTVVPEETSHIRKREEYLKRQRDSIIAKKRKERETELKHFLSDNPQYNKDTPSTTSNPVLVKQQQQETPLPKDEEKRGGKGTNRESKKIKDKILSLKSKKKGPVMTPQVADKL